MEEDCSVDWNRQAFNFELVDPTDTKYHLVSSTGGCADLSVEGSIVGTPIVEGTCAGTESQEWWLTGIPGQVQIRSVSLDLCMTATGTANSVVLLQECESVAASTIWTVDVKVLLTELE
uniref:Ricin B lectin domain-containing protein n=1 Tax=Grammatophora oceanica TaxID=210454 RepID=A0A7S1UN51_9STRA